jgi:hypothetical protein
MNAQWILGGGRNIETPEGTFYLTYGSDSNGNPHFKDFAKLDAIARQVSALPELIAALEWALSQVEDDPDLDHQGAVSAALAALAKAKGEKE